MKPIQERSYNRAAGRWLWPSCAAVVLGISQLGWWIVARALAWALD